MGHPTCTSGVKVKRPLLGEPWANFQIAWVPCTPSTPHQSLCFISSRARLAGRSQPATPRLPGGTVHSTRGGSWLAWWPRWARALAPRRAQSTLVERMKGPSGHLRHGGPHFSAARLGAQSCNLVAASWVVFEVFRKENLIRMFLACLSLSSLGRGSWGDSPSCANVCLGERAPAPLLTVNVGKPPKVNCRRTWAPRRSRANALGASPDCPHPSPPSPWRWGRQLPTPPSWEALFRGDHGHRPESWRGGGACKTVTRPRDKYFTRDA